tara:strand:+ start:54 stop:305 length:252 start_codon:yes stop_codon:yes gene_type:complete
MGCDYAPTEHTHEHTHDEYDNGVCLVNQNPKLCYPNVNIAECIELGETNMGLNSSWQNYTCEFLCENLSLLLAITDESCEIIE